MTNVNEKKGSHPQVAEFYDGKSIFLTGSAGFLGVILLETLLELCPGIKSIYVLLRAKKGVEPEKRKEEMFSRVVFDKLKQDMPEVLEKVHVLTGDVSKPNLGMNEEDLQKVAEDANIFFHCAASISFFKPLKYILEQNALGTKYAIDVCRKIKRLDAFVYTSTAFCNCNRKTSIQETIYRLPFPAKTFLDEIREGTDESLTQLVSEVHPPWPNFYTFSKNLTENVLQDYASDLPVIIVRPSIIGSTWKRPLPGYVEETSGITALSIAVGKGFLKVMNGDPNNSFDFINGDLTASIHVVAAWSIGTGRSPPLHVINCTSSIKLTLNDYCVLMLDLVKRRPLPKTFRKPTSVKIVKNPVLYWAWAAYEHYIPAYFFDVFLKLSGSKLRMIPIYEFAEKAIQSTTYFMTNQWTFHAENFHSLINQLQVEDKKKFELEETNIDGAAAIEDLPDGAPVWDWSSDKKTLPVRMKSATQRLWITNAFKTVFIVSLLSLLYLIFIFALELVN